MEKIIYQAEPCLLWERARILAKERGLEMGEKCPLDNICNGHACLMSVQTDKQKLEKLREELKKITKDIVIGC